ncbi:MAG: ATP-grasp domain-containing protein, partial [Hyphomicrobiales bacterium]
FVPVIHAAVPDRPDEQDTLDTASAIAASLMRAGFTAEIIDIGSDSAPLSWLAVRRPHIVFNLVESVGGDGSLAHLPVRLMERLGMRYTGANASACELTSSKIHTKEVLAGHGIPTPRWWTGGSEVPGELQVIVKSDSEHASLGIDANSVVDGHGAGHEIASREQRFGGVFFAEEFIEGREFNVALIEEDGAPLVLPIPEILFDDLPAGRPRIVDYEAKWDPESHAYHNTPRCFGVEDREPVLAAELARLALGCWHAVGLSGYARVDFRVDGGGRPTVLEINTNPCLAQDAGFVATAAAAGIVYDDLIARVVNAARIRTAKVA